jgi:hypothetical protein
MNEAVQVQRLSTDEAVVRHGKVLLSFMSENEAAAFVSTQSPQAFEELRSLWETARAAYSALPTTELQPPALRELPSEVFPELAVIEAAPVFQENFGGREYQFKLVEIDRLVAFQQFVDSQFSVEAANGALGNGTMLEKVRFCLPRDFSTPLSIVPEQNGLNILSLSRNINVRGIEVQQQPDQPLKVAFVVSARANWVQVAEFEGRYFLKNGYHRTWVLRHLGDEYVPAIVTKATSVEEVGAGPGFFPPALILSDRAPMFEYFFNDALAPQLALKSTMKVIRLSAQESVLPRLP